jgi:predicted RNA-binding Zn-ribbon protein involved in translation (DUF1610 family)
VTTKLTSTETVKEIQIDMNRLGVYYTDYFQAKRDDIVIINVSATKYGVVPARLKIRQQETNAVVFGDVEGSLFQFDVSLPSDGTYRVEIFNMVGPISANGTVTLRRILFNFGVGIIFVGALVMASGLSIYGYQQMKLKREKRKMEKTRVCPFCNQSVPIEETVCPHCGFDVTRSVRCKYCSGFYDRYLAKCPNCGAKKS